MRRLVDVLADILAQSGHHTAALNTAALDLHLY